MKKHIFTLLIVSVFAGASAQDAYHPITEGCTWSVSNEKYMTAGDTVLDGKTYLKIYRQVSNQPFEFSLDNAEYFAAIRNDSAEKKVYAYLPAGTLVYNQFNHASPTDLGRDVLLYDFSLQFGQTITYYSLLPQCNAAKEIVAFRTNSVNVPIEEYEYYEDTDSLVTMSDSSTRHRILLHTNNIGTNYSDIWIESIGRLAGFNDPNSFSVDEPWTILLCYSDSAGVFYQTGYDKDNEPNDCFCNGYGGDVQKQESVSFSIYPNPTSNYLHIDIIESDSPSFFVVVLNECGKNIISSKCFEKTSLLDLRKLPSGIYSLIIKTHNHNIVRKIIKL